MRPSDHNQPYLAGQWVGCVIRPDLRTAMPLPLSNDAVPAGFPSPAEEYLEKTLDLNEHLIRRPEATFFVRVSGDSMMGAGIHHDDILIVDRGKTAVPGNVVIAFVDGEFTVKRLQRTETGIELAPENPDYDAIPINEEMDFQIWGVVEHVIHKV